MIDYSSKLQGAINHRTKKSNEALLLIANVTPDNPCYQELLQQLNREFIEQKPDYLPQIKVKALKKLCNRDREKWMKDLDVTYEIESLNLLNKLFKEGFLSYEQKFFLGCTFTKCYDWWYQSDEELKDAKIDFAEHPEEFIPVLKREEEIYQNCHTAKENLYDVLKEESKTVQKYCARHSWPIISPEWIINSLEELKNLVLSSNNISSDWDFEQQLVLQFRRVRSLNPENEIWKACYQGKPENYMMSTRGNNYNDYEFLRRTLERLGWNGPIPTSVGSLFWYRSKIFPEMNGANGQTELIGVEFDYYNYGTGKKNGGSFRIFYYTSPQNNMMGNVATKVIVKGQEQNRYCAYRDQRRGQDPLFYTIDGVGIDSTEYSDHQTITLLKWILELYGFGRFSEPLALSLQLPVKVGDNFLQPPNGSLAGGKLDVALINDAGLVISWLIGKYTKEKLEGYICGDDWTFYFNHIIKEKDFKAMHSMCTFFNQIVNSDKTEWLARDKFLGFCKVIVKEKDSQLIPATGLPVNLWLKEPSCIRDIAQIASSLVKTKQLSFLFSEESQQQEMLIKLAKLWEKEILEAESIFGSPDTFDKRLESSLAIPVEFGGLLLNEEYLNFEILLNGVINGVNRIIDDYKHLPVKIASFIQSAGITGPFADYLSKEMMSGLDDLLSLIQNIVTVVNQWDQTGLYDIALLRLILRKSQDLAQDYMSNSDGKSRKSTKDRTTPIRDGDCYLDGYKQMKRDFKGLDKKMSLNDLVLLDCINANPELTSIHKLLTFRNIRFQLERFYKLGLISSYEGHGNYSGVYYYCIKYHDGRRIRISPVENDSPTENGSFLPLSEIPPGEFRDFVIGCRQLLRTGDLAIGLGITQEKLIGRIIRRNIEKKRAENRKAERIHKEQPYSPWAIADEEASMNEWLKEFDWN